MDHDIVEVSNLHRQVMHTESSAGTSKAFRRGDEAHCQTSRFQVESAKRALLALNSSVDVAMHQVKVNTDLLRHLHHPLIPSELHSDTISPHLQVVAENVLGLVEGYDVIVDATDNPTSRRLP